MNHKERFIIAIALGGILVMVGMDLVTDIRGGIAVAHVLVEAAIGVLALAGIFYLLRGSFALRRRLEFQAAEFSAYQRESEQWRQASRKYLDGLSQAIDEQLTKWQLSAAEKEVAFLLLKGLGIKEIAAVRGTTEKTARVQSAAIYAKAGLAGRSELAAFFLEDLLVPTASTPTGVRPPEASASRPLP